MIDSQSAILNPLPVAMGKTLLSLWGDPEDCADCRVIQDRPCRVHGSAVVSIVVERAAKANRAFTGPDGQA